MRLLLNGVEYESTEAVVKALNRVPVLPYIELEEQARVNLDELDARALPWRKLLACWVFLLRRSVGEQVTFTEVAGELVPEDVVLDLPGDDDETAGDDGGGGAPDPTSPGDEPSPT